MTRLAVPINSGELICYMDMLRPAPVPARTTRSAEDTALINKAKRLLINHYNMTEPQAHRFIEKKSMDTGKSMADIARKLLN